MRALAPPRWPKRRLMLFFGLTYLAYGIAGRLAKQPFTYYVKVPVPWATMAR